MQLLKELADILTARYSPSEIPQHYAAPGNNRVGFNDEGFTHIYVGYLTAVRDTNDVALYSLETGQEMVLLKGGGVLLGKPLVFLGAVQRGDTSGPLQFVGYRIRLPSPVPIGGDGG